MNYKNEIFIGKRRIALDEPTYFIADIAANHDGDLNRAKDLIFKLSLSHTKNNAVAFVIVLKAA